MINKMKRQHMEWEKIFANNISDKGLISKIYKKLIQHNSQNRNNPFKLWAQNIDIFPKKIFKWPTGTRKDTQHH